MAMAFASWSEYLNMILDSNFIIACIKPIFIGHYDRNDSILSFHQKYSPSITSFCISKNTLSATDAHVVHI